MNLKSFLSLLFFEHDISVTIKVFDLKLCVHILKVPLEGRVSQIFYLGFSFYFMSKNG